MDEYTFIPHLSQEQHTMSRERYRDEQGRFVNGHPGGPGRLPKAHEQRLQTVLTNKLDDETWGLILDQAIKQAKEGDAMARKFLAAYSLGTPVHRSSAANDVTPADWIAALRGEDPLPGE
jgi:hypothetical protein